MLRPATPETKDFVPFLEAAEEVVRAAVGPGAGNRQLACGLRHFGDELLPPK